jgi:predicted phage gp36 major capsid-like protein
MSEMFTSLYNLLADVVVPKLKGIEASQAEQRLQSEQLSSDIKDFRAEMRIRFAEIRAEIAACQAQVEDAMVTLRESDAGETDDDAFRGKKPLIH